MNARCGSVLALLFLIQGCGSDSNVHDASSGPPDAASSDTQDGSLADDAGSPDATVGTDASSLDASAPDPAGEDAARPIPTGPYTIRVISHNIAGGPINRGDPAATAAVEAQIDNWHPVIVGLQEVCFNQFEHLRAKYAPRGWSLEFTALRATHPRCTHTGAAVAQGQVLMAAYPMTNVTRDDLGHDDGDKNFTLMCGDVAIPELGQPARACTTHLRVNGTDPTGEHKRALLRNIHDLLDPFARTPGRSVVLTGDFNARPEIPAMDVIYRLRLDGRHLGPGEFREADQTDPRACPDRACRNMRPTMDGGARIDYVLFSRNTAAHDTLSGGTVASPTSDHHIKRGRVELTP